MKKNNKNITFKIAKEDDNEILQTILQENEMDSWIQISLERNPNYFDSHNLFGETISILAYENDTVIGIYSGTYFKVFFQNKIQIILYLGSLRIQKQFRQKIRFLKEGFKSIPYFFTQTTTLPFMFTSLAKGNKKAIRLLEANIKDMPRYNFLTNLQTYAFKPQKVKKNIFVQATKDDVTKIVKFYNTYNQQFDFAPVMEENWILNLDEKKGLTINDFYILKENNEIVCMFALWDQRSIKQTVVRGYNKTLNPFVRFLYNLYAHYTNGVKLPKIGEKIQQVYISFFTSIYENDKNIELLKIASSLVCNKGADVCIIGFDEKNPFTQVIKQTIKAQIYVTRIDSVFLNNKDIADIQIGIIKPEVALL